jgi:hypothetical protein
MPKTAGRGARMAPMSKAKTADALVKELTPPLRAVMQRLRTFVKKRAPQLDEQIKWGGVCWVGDGVVCYAHPLQKHVDFGFFQGVRLKDPKGVLEGSGKFLRHVKVTAPSDIREREFAALLKQAIAVDLE